MITFPILTAKQKKTLFLVGVAGICSIILIAVLLSLYLQQIQLGIAIISPYYTDIMLGVGSISLLLSILAFYPTIVQVRSMYASLGYTKFIDDLQQVVRGLSKRNWLYISITMTCLSLLLTLIQLIVYGTNRALGSLTLATSAFGCLTPIYMLKAYSVSLRKTKQSEESIEQRKKVDEKAAEVVQKAGENTNEIIKDVKDKILKHAKSPSVASSTGGGGGTAAAGGGGGAVNAVSGGAAAGAGTAGAVSSATGVMSSISSATSSIAMVAQAAVGVTVLVTSIATIAVDSSVVASNNYYTALAAAQLATLANISSSCYNTTVIGPADWVVSTISGGPRNVTLFPTSVDGVNGTATFSYPVDLLFDLNGNLIVLEGSGLIRSINLNSGLVTTKYNTSNLLISQQSPLSGYQFSSFSLSMDSLGNFFIANDYSNNQGTIGGEIAKISTSGIITSVAGNGTSGSSSGQAGASRLSNSAYGTAIDDANNLYISDGGNGCIRMVTTAGYITDFIGNCSTNNYGFISDGYGVNSSIGDPFSLVYYKGSLYYSTFVGYSSIRKIQLSDLLVSTLAGGGQFGNVVKPTPGTDGEGAIATFLPASSLAIDSFGNTFFTDPEGCTIRMINTTGYVSTVSGNITKAWNGNQYLGGSYVNGIAKQATFNGPYAIAIDSNDDLYIADTFNQAIRKISNNALTSTVLVCPTITSTTTTTTTTTSASSCIVTSFVGGTFSGDQDGIGSSAKFNNPSDIVMSTSGVFYVADLNNNLIRKISANGNVTTWAGDGNAQYLEGIGTNSSFYMPTGLFLNVNSTLFVSDSGNAVIRSILPDGTTSTWAGSGNSTIMDGQGINANFMYPWAVTGDIEGNLYVADGYSYIRKNSPSGLVTTIGGSSVIGAVDGIGVSASFNNPSGLALDETYTYLYISDWGTNLIRRMNLATLRVVTIAGSGKFGSQDGLGSQASFNRPNNLLMGGDGNLYIADSTNNLIRRMTPSGMVTTVAGVPLVQGQTNGPGLSALLSGPTGMVFDNSGNLYFCDNGNSAIRKITF